MFKKILSILVLTVFAIASSYSTTRPDLGAANSFAIFTGAGAISNTGLSVLTGDIGTFTTPITGFPPGIYSGTLHQLGDPVATLAKNDLNTAWTALGLVTCDETIGVTMGGGQVLTPKTYCTTALTTITGNLTFDALGDPNAIFLVKIGGALNSAGLVHVILANGAQACNIYWAVDGAVAILNNSIFKGTIVANGAINISDGSRLEGRALSLNGAINIANVVAKVPVDAGSGGGGGGFPSDAIRVAGQSSQTNIKDVALNLTLRMYNAANTEIYNKDFPGIYFSSENVFSFVWDVAGLTYNPVYNVKLENQANGLIVFEARLDKIVNAQSQFGAYIEPIEMNLSGGFPITGDFSVSGVSELLGNVFLGSDPSDVIVIDGTATFNAPVTTEGLLDIHGPFALDGAEGGVGQLIVGQGAGNTPIWQDLSAVMADLTDGKGIADFTYDGVNPAVVEVDLDGTSLIFSAATDPAVITLNMAYGNHWTANQWFDLVNVDGGTIDGATINNSSIGITTSAAGKFTTMTATTANITDLALTGFLKLDGVEGALNEIMIGKGVGNTPGWTTVAALMADLTDGEGIADFTYDGSSAVTIKTDIDNNTLEYDIAGIDGKIRVNEDANFTWLGGHIFNKNVTLGNGDADDVIVNTTDWSVNAAGNARFQGTLDVYGVSSFHNNVIIDDLYSLTVLNIKHDGVVGNLDAVKINDDLNIFGDVVADRAVRINGTLFVDQAATFDFTVDVQGAFSSKANTTLGDNPIIDVLNVNSISVFNGTVELSKELKLFGSTPLAGNALDLPVSQGAGLPPKWTSIADLLKDLTDGAGIVDFTYDGSAVAKVIADPDMQTIIWTDLVVTDDSKMKVNQAWNYNWTGINTWAGSSTFNGPVTLGNGDADDVIVNTADWTVNAAGNIHTEGTLDVDGATTLNLTLIVDGDATFNNALTQTDIAQLVTFAGNVNANLGLDVMGADLTVGGILSIDDATGFIKSTAVAGVTVNDDLVVNGNSDLNGTLDVSGQVDLGAIATMTTVRGNFNVDVATDLDGTLNVDGAADFNADVELNGTLTDINNSVGAANDILVSTVTGTDWKSVADLMADLTDGEGIVDFTYDGSLAVKVKTDIDGVTLEYDVVGDDGKIRVNEDNNFTWLGNHIFNKNVTLGDGGVGDAITVNDDKWTVDVNGNAWFLGTMTVRDDLIVGAGSGLLNVDVSAAVVTIAGDAVVNQDLQVNQDATIDQNFTVENGHTSINGDMTIGQVAARKLMTINSYPIFTSEVRLPGSAGLDNEGNNKDIMVSKGTDANPQWVSVATLMEDLTDGEGIVDFTYDGSAPMVVKTDIDGVTLEYDVAGVDGKIRVNEDNNFTWLGNHIFNANVTLGDGGVGDAIIVNDDMWTVNASGNIHTEGTLDVDGATTLNNTLDVDGVADFNSTVQINNAQLQIYNNLGNLIVHSGEGHSDEGYIKTLCPDGTSTLVTIGSTAVGERGAVSVGYGTTDTPADWYASMVNLTGFGLPPLLDGKWMVGTGELMLQKGVGMFYDETAEAGAIYMFNGLFTAPTFSVNNLGNVYAGGTLVVDGAADFNADVELNGTLTDLGNTVGALDDILTSTGAGTDWKSVGDLMKDLTDGAGIVDFTYDGSADATVIADPDLETIIWKEVSIDPLDDRLMVNEDWDFEWTGDNSWAGISDFNNVVNINDNYLRVYNFASTLIIDAGPGHGDEGYLETYSPGGTKLVTLGATGAAYDEGAVSVYDNTGTLRAGLGYNAGNWSAGVAGTGTLAGALTTGGADAKLAVYNGAVEAFSADQDGVVYGATFHTRDADNANGVEIGNSNALNAGYIDVNGSDNNPVVVLGQSDAGGLNGSVSVRTGGVVKAGLYVDAAGNGAVGVVDGTTQAGASTLAGVTMLSVMDGITPMFIANDLGDVYFNHEVKSFDNQIVISTGVGSPDVTVPYVNFNMTGGATVLEIGRGDDNTNYGIKINTDAGVTRAGMGWESTLARWVTGVQGNLGYAAGAMTIGANDARLSVYGAGTEKFYANELGNVWAAGNTDLDGTLNVDGAADFNADVELNSTLTDINNTAGVLDDILTSTGTGTDWKSIADLMDDLTDGAGIVDFTYDGSAPAQVIADPDLQTIIWTDLVVTDNSKMMVNQAWNYNWTGTNTWAGTSTFNNTLTATTNVFLGNGDDNVVIAATNWTVNAAGDIHTEGTLDVDGATTLNSTLDVDGIADFNNTVQINDDYLEIYNNNPNLILRAGSGASEEGYLKTFSPLGDNTIVTLGATLNGTRGAVSVGYGADNSYLNRMASMAFVSIVEFPALTGTLLADKWMVGTGDMSIQKGIGMFYGAAGGPEFNIFNGDFTNPTFSINNLGNTHTDGTLDVDGATTLNSTLNVDGLSDFNADVRINGWELQIYADDASLVLDAGEGGSGEGYLTTLDPSGTKELVILGSTGAGLQGAVTVLDNGVLRGGIGYQAAITSWIAGVQGTLNNLAGAMTTGGADAKLSVYGGGVEMFYANQAGAVHTEGTLDVDGATTLNSTLDVDGISTFRNSLVMNDGSETLTFPIPNVTANYSITFPTVGPTAVKQILYTTTATNGTMAWGLVDADMIDLTDDYAWTGNHSFDADVRLGDGGVGDEITVNDDMWTVNAVGNAMFKGTLDVTGVATFDGGITDANDDANGTEWFITDLGTASFDGDMTVYGGAGLSGGLITLGDFATGGTPDRVKIVADFAVNNGTNDVFTITGLTGNTILHRAADFTMKNAGDASDIFSVDGGTGNTLIAGTLGVTGLGTFTTGITRDGAGVGSSLVLSDDVQITGGLAVNGMSTLTGATVNGTLTVSVGNASNLNGPTTINSSLNVTGLATMQGNLGVYGTISNSAAGVMPLTINDPDGINITGLTNIISGIDVQGTFALDNVQGAVGELMVGMGSGITPTWTTVGALMQDLTAGHGILYTTPAGTTYDGSVARTITVDETASYTWTTGTHTFNGPTTTIGVGYTDLLTVNSTSTFNERVNVQKAFVMNTVTIGDKTTLSAVTASIVDYTDNAPVGDLTLVTGDLPTGVLGQVMYIYNNSGNPMTILGESVPDGNLITIIYIGGAWRPINMP